MPRRQTVRYSDGSIVHAGRDGSVRKARYSENTDRFGRNGCNGAKWEEWVDTPAASTAFSADSYAAGRKIAASGGLAHTGAHLRHLRGTAAEMGSAARTRRRLDRSANRRDTDYGYHETLPFGSAIIFSRQLSQRD
jgi:hypothetical protein